MARSKAAKCGIGRGNTARIGRCRGQDTLFIAAGHVRAVGPGGGRFSISWSGGTWRRHFGKRACWQKNLGRRRSGSGRGRILHDLRVPVYSHELLFVRNSPAGKAFLSAWRAECRKLGDERLAFLRALYARQADILCVASAVAGRHCAARDQRPERRQRNDCGQGEPLIMVEILPGRFIKCHERDRAVVIERYQRLQGGKGGMADKVEQIRA